MEAKLTKKIKGSDFMKMKESDKVNLAIAGIFLVCIILGYIVLIPKIGVYRDSKIRIENDKLQKESLEKKAELLNGLGEKLKSEELFIERAKNVLPTEPQVPELLLTIDKIAINNSLYMNTFTPTIEKENQAETVEGAPEEGGEVQKSVAWKTVKLQFDIVGKYLDVKSFIIDLENNIRPIDITNISISGGGDLTSDENILRFNIGANAYYQ